MISQYIPFDIRLFNHEAGADGEHFCVQVESRIGEQATPERVTVPPGFQDRLSLLERRQFDDDDAALIAIGTEIGALMLPPGARAFFHAALSNLREGEGLRLRIKCAEVELDRIPWEFAYVERGLDGAGSAMQRRGFIVGDTRLSIVRYVIGAAFFAPIARRTLGWRLLAVACEPDDLRDPDNPLQIERELGNLRSAVEAAGGIKVTHCQPSTREALQDLLLGGAEIFHFAGHGEFRPAAVAGGQALACLMLQRADGCADEWEVDQLAQRLASKGIQLAMIGACRSAQTDGLNSWAGIAPSLVRAGIPAVIGMQYTVYDASAIAFSKMFYSAWARGCEIDEAVAEARSAIADLGRGRDFATPVLYMRVPSLRIDIRVEEPDHEQRDDQDKQRLKQTLAQIAQLYDYKLVHDALHSARMGPFALIQLRCAEYPAGSTAREIAKHARDLKMRLQDVRRVVDQARCDATLMQEIESEFSGAVASLDQALTDRAGEQLEDALAAFDTLLTTQPARVDTWMVALAKGLNLDPLVAFLRGMGADADVQVAEALRHRGERLRKGAAMHSVCQSIDNRLAVIRKAAEAQRFREIRRQWRPLSDALARILPDWTADGGDRLRRNTDELDRGVAANDQPATDAVFDDFCGDFDFGFYTLDSDLKQLCGEMREDTAASFAGGRLATQG